MTLDSTLLSPAPSNPFSANDVITILRERGWLQSSPSAEQAQWGERAVALLGPHAADRSALADLLSLVFYYNAHDVLASTDAHVVLSRYGARDVVRELALLLLKGSPLNSDHFQEMVTALKEKLEVRGRELFHPLRLALAGRSGEGELDRVILLLEEAEAAHFAQPVKSARTRIVEFCAALD
jgi:nondiscriminating glutamyl-tRNA synthetase